MTDQEIIKALRCCANSFEDVADYLISNGVTVQEWIPVTERLPERDKEVLLIVHGWEDRLYYTGCLHRQEAERSWLTGIESKASDWKIWGFSYLREPNVSLSCLDAYGTTSREWKM